MNRIFLDKGSCSLLALCASAGLFAVPPGLAWAGEVTVSSGGTVQTFSDTSNVTANVPGGQVTISNGTADYTLGSDKNNTFSVQGNEITVNGHTIVIPVSGGGTCSQNNTSSGTPASTAASTPASTPSSASASTSTNSKASTPSGSGASPAQTSAGSNPSGGNASQTASRANPQFKALSEGRLSGLAFVNQGADLVAGSGIAAALAATAQKQQGLAPFAAVGGGSSRYATGSHADVKGVSMLAGLAWRGPAGQADNSLMAGAFFEAGSGNYNTFNSFTSAPSARGKGDTKYYGGGIMGRYGAAPGQSGFYGEASARAGSLGSTFSSGDIYNFSGRADYDSAYYGAHAGLGYIWRMTGQISLDLSTKYIWTHQNGATARIAGDAVDFRAANSQRWRSGARLSYALSEAVTFYAGGYYDHEFDGQARTNVNGNPVTVPKLTGGTGTGELGLVVKPAGAASPLTVDLGAQAYTGVRSGASGTLRLKYEF